MKKFFSYDKTNGDYEHHDTLEEAKKEAEASIEYYRDEAHSDGWPSDIDIGYGMILASTSGVNKYSKKDFLEEEWDEMGFSSDFEEVCDYELKDV